jgi:hypothetical protein
MGRARLARVLDLRPKHDPHIRPCRPGPQLGWAVLDLDRAKNYVLYIDLGTIHLYAWAAAYRIAGSRTPWPWPGRPPVAVAVGCHKLPTGCRSGGSREGIDFLWLKACNV